MVHTARISEDIGFDCNRPSRVSAFDLGRVYIEPQYKEEPKRKRGRPKKVQEKPQPIVVLPPEPKKVEVGQPATVIKF